MKHLVLRGLMVTLVIGGLYGVFPRSASATEVVYSSDFSVDPEWTTDQEENFHWQASTSALFAHIVNRPPEPAYSPNRYIVTQTDLDPNRDFRLTWDTYIDRIYDNGAVVFGLYAPDLVSQNRTNIYVPRIISQGTANIKLMSFKNTDNNYQFIAVTDDGVNKGSGGSGTASKFKRKIWYEMGIEHNVASSTMTFWVREKETGLYLHNVTRSLGSKPQFDPLMQYVGISMYPDGEINTPMSETEARLAGSSDFLIDNVLLVQDHLAPDPEPEIDPLILQYEPILYFHENEDFYPMNVEPFIESSALWDTNGLGEDTQLIPEGEVGVDDIAVEGSEDWYLAFSTPDEAKSFNPIIAKGKYDELVTSGRAVPTYYAHRMDQDDWTVLQYWYFYAFNGWQHELKELGNNNHEGDWESVFVFLDRNTRQPEYIAYSSHLNDGDPEIFNRSQYDSVRRKWDDSEMKIVDHRPVSFVALGSHANYPKKVIDGIHIVPTPIKDFQDWTSDRGKSLDPELWQIRKFFGATDPSWVTYEGKWGSDGALLPGSDGPQGPKFIDVNLFSNLKRFAEPVKWAGLDKISTESGDGVATNYSFLNQLTNMVFSEPMPAGTTVTSDQHDELITFGNLEEVNLLPRFWDFSTSLENGTFDVNVQLGYTDEEVEAAGMAETRLSVFLYDPEERAWNEIDSTVDTSTNAVSFQTTHFSRYAIGQKVVINTPPVLDPIGDQTVAEGSALTFVVAASDPDVDDTLTYSATNLPPGATFDPLTRTFTWDTDFDDAGNYSDIEFTVVDDGEPLGLDVELITITVGDVNRAPVFENPGPQEVLEDEVLEFVVSSSDPDGDSVTLVANALPDGATFSTSTGVFVWEPTRSQEGIYVVTFTATDDGGPQESTSLDVVITVGDNPTPVELSQDLIELVISYQLPHELESAYLANLKKVPTFIEEGKITPAIEQLEAFKLKVASDYKKGKLDSATKDNVWAEVNDILRAIAG